jgi:uncharacterized membrane-anchored protein
LVLVFCHPELDSGSRFGFEFLVLKPRPVGGALYLFFQPFQGESMSKIIIALLILLFLVIFLLLFWIIILTLSLLIFGRKVKRGRTLRPKIKKS